MSSKQGAFLRAIQAEAEMLAKKVIHIAINAPLNTAVRCLGQHGVQPSETILTLLRSLQGAATIVCQAQHWQTRREWFLPKNCSFFHLEAVEACFITTLIEGLRNELHNASNCAQYCMVHALSCNLVVLLFCR